jgi:predicted DNA-binding transcriptional regulator AlpA
VRKAKQQNPSAIKPSQALEELRSKSPKNFLLQREVLTLVRLSRIEVYRRYNRKEFPIPFRQGNRTLVWKASEVFAWMDSLPRVTVSPKIKFGGDQ